MYLVTLMISRYEAQLQQLIDQTGSFWLKNFPDSVTLRLIDHHVHRLHLLFLLFGWLERSPWRRNGGVVFLDMSLYIFLPNLRHNSISFVLSSHLSCQYGVPEDAWHPDESTVLMILVHLTPFRYPGSRAIAYRFRLLRWDSINHIGKLEPTLFRLTITDDSQLRRPSFCSMLQLRIFILRSPSSVEWFPHFKKHTRNIFEDPFILPEHNNNNTRIPKPFLVRQLSDIDPF